MDKFYKGIIKLVLLYLKQGDVKEATRLLEGLIREDK